MSDKIGLKQRIKRIRFTGRKAVPVLALIAAVMVSLFGCSASETEVLCAERHDYKIVSVVDPTCATNGYTQYECTVCKDRKTEEVETIAHEFTSSVYSEATCIKGEVIRYVCSVCGYSYDEIGDELSNEHDYSEFEVLNEPGCNDAGTKEIRCSLCGDKYTEEIPALGHEYTVTDQYYASCLANGYASYTCTRCGDSYTETLYAFGHYFLSATCSSPEMCAYCGETRGEPLGHTFSGECPYCGEIYYVGDDAVMKCSEATVVERISDKSLSEILQERGLRNPLTVFIYRNYIYVWC